MVKKMKARLPMNKKEKDKIKQEVEKEYEKQGNAAMRRIFKLMCAVLNEEKGYGKIRCSQIIGRIGELSEKHRSDEVFWTHIDKVVIDQMGMEFDREDYSIMDR